MAKRAIVAQVDAPLKDVEKSTPQSTETFDLLVRKIPDQAEVDFIKLKKKMKAKGIKALANGERVSLSGYMKEALLEKLERDLAE
ncbi:hypothetical protein G6Z94_11650 [Vibrio aestuarianus]|uniref:hypothetical protein n=1 Tax=Vibrio aestuarianus TaxID=28171 RepID=UPI001592C498|nr:hypothetical protein [Vibrio aestuarianus]NGZ17993.1 hypothetical protein [Vibrio aestuarianus]